jgi:hypothetical protein
VDEEVQHARFFVRIQPLLDLFPQSGAELGKIRAIRDFVAFRPFLRYSLSYAFTGFDSPEFPHNLLDICNRYDFNDVAHAIAAAFDVQISGYLLKRMRLQIAEGFYDMIPAQVQGVTFEKDESLDNAWNFLIPVVTIPVFDPETLSQFRGKRPQSASALPPLFVYQQLKVAVHKRIGLSSCRDEPIIPILTHVFAPSASLVMFTSLKLFDQVYSTLMNCEITQRLELFTRSVFPAAISAKGGFTSLVKYIKQRDSALSATRSLWMGLTTFCEDHNLLYTLFEIHRLRNYFDDAAMVALDLFHREDVTSRQLHQLAHAQFCLSESLHYRSNPEEKTFPAFRPRESQSVESIQSLLTITEFLQAVVEFCMQRQVLFMRDYNILKSGQTAVMLGALLLITGGDQLLEKLGRLTPVTIADVTVKAGEMLSDLPLPDILRNMKELIQARPALARELNTALLKRIAMSDNRAYIPTIIITCWTKPEDQCILFLEYGYLMEGFQTALTAKLQHYLPMIAYKGSLLGDVTIVRSCEKMLG